MHKRAAYDSMGCLLTRHHGDPTKCTRGDKPERVPAVRRRPRVYECRRASVGACGVTVSLGGSLGHWRFLLCSAGVPSPCCGQRKLSCAKLGSGLQQNVQCRTGVPMQ